MSLYEMEPEVYDAYMSTQMEGRNYDEVFSCIRRAAKFGCKTRVLDLCCGTAIIARNWLSRLGNIQYVGVDINESFLEFATKQIARNPAYGFVHEDATEVTLGNDFDIVITTSGYHHIMDSKKRAFLRNMTLHLKNDGTGIIYEKLVAPFNSVIGAVRSGTNFYAERIVDMIQEERLTDTQLFALYNELYLTSTRRDEYKVPYAHLMGDLKAAGFAVAAETKLWPKDNRFQDPKVGDFVFVVGKTVGKTK